MQNAVPKGEGGMIAVLGSNIKTIETILEEKKIFLIFTLQMIILKVNLLLVELLEI